MNRIVIHPDADTEIIAATQWYDEQRAGLGSEFLDEFEAALARIRLAPETYGVLINRIRQHKLHRFPFAVVYRVESDRIFVLAVMHLHRDPDYWRHRT